MPFSQLFFPKSDAFLKLFFSSLTNDSFLQQSDLFSASTLNRCHRQRDFDSASESLMGDPLFKVFPFFSLSLSRGRLNAFFRQGYEKPKLLKRASFVCIFVMDNDSMRHARDRAKKALAHMHINLVLGSWMHMHASITSLDRSTSMPRRRFTVIVYLTRLCSAAYVTHART